MVRLILAVAVGISFASVSGAQEPVDPTVEGQDIPETTRGRADETSPSSSRSPYLVLGGGVFVPAHSNLDGYEAGPSLHIGHGKFIGDNLAFELNGALSIARGSASGYGVAVNSTAVIVPLDFLLKLSTPPESTQVYVVAGAGLTITSVDVAVSTSSGSEEASDTAFGPDIQAGAGLGLRMSPAVSLAFDARYHIASVENAGIRTRLDHFTLGALLTFW